MNVVKNSAGTEFIVSGGVDYVHTKPDGMSVVVSPTLDAEYEGPAWNVTVYYENGDAFVSVIEGRPLEETLDLANHFVGELQLKSEEFETWTELLMRNYELVENIKQRDLYTISEFLKTLPEYKRVFDEGFYLEDTGGGGLGFIKVVEGESQYLLLTSSPMSIYDRPTSKTWAISRNVTVEGNFIHIEGSDMDAMLDIHSKIPPVKASDAPERIYSRVEDFLQEHEASAPAP